MKERKEKSREREKGKEGKKGKEREGEEEKKREVKSGENTKYKTWNDEQKQSENIEGEKVEVKEEGRKVKEKSGKQLSGKKSSVGKDKKAKIKDDYEEEEGRGKKIETQKGRKKEGKQKGEREIREEKFLSKSEFGEEFEREWDEYVRQKPEEYEETFPKYYDFDFLQTDEVGKTFQTRKVDLPEGEFHYSSYVKITGKDFLKEVNFPQFIASILSLGKIPIGEIVFRSSYLGQDKNKVRVEVDFIPSFIIQMVSKHERISYTSEICYDDKMGHICVFSEYSEVKKDGRRFGKKEVFPVEKGVKDPVSVLLDFIGSELVHKIFNPEKSSVPIPIEVKREKDKIEVSLKGLEEEEKLFRSAELKFDSDEDGKSGILPRKATIYGLLSLIDLVVERK